MQPGAYLDSAVERLPLVDHVGKSGARLERVVLPDGRRLVVKRSTPGTDLLMALTEEVSSRELTLWASGVLDRLPPGVGHAVVDGWHEQDAAVVVMRDLGDAVLTWEDRLSTVQCLRVVRAVADLHRAFVGHAPDGLTPLPRLVGLFRPKVLAPYAHDANPLPDLALRGWEIFRTVVPLDVAAPVLALLDDLSPLVEAMVARPCTLVHGDLATVNMAFEGERLTLLDWSMPAVAPGALDLARFIAGCASVVDASREQMIETYARAWGSEYDETAMRLALLSAVLFLGWNKALDSVESPDPGMREQESADLAWWVEQARQTLHAGLL